MATLAALALIGVLACSGDDVPASEGASAAGTSPERTRRASTTAKRSTTAPAPETSPTRPSTTTTSPWAEPTGDPVVESMTAELAQSPVGPGEDGHDLAEHEARCLSATLVRTVGMDGLAEVGEQLSPGEPFDFAALTPEQRSLFAGALLECLDVEALLVDQLAQLDALGPSDLACVVSNLADNGAVTDLLRRAVVEDMELTGREAALMGPMLSAFGACLDDEDLDRLQDADS